MILPDNLDDLPPLTAEQLGAFLNVTGERIRQLAKEGVITKVARGQFEWRRSILAYCNWIRDGKSKSTGGGGGDDDGNKDALDRQRTRMTRAKADRAEIETAIITGRVHEASAVQAAWMDSALAARSKLLGIPSKLAPQIDPARAVEIKELITDAIHDALTDLANYDPQKIAERTDTKRLFAGVAPGDGGSLETAAEADALDVG